MSDVKNLTKDTFQEALSASAKKLLIIDFFAPWCGPCKIQGPMVDELAKEMDADKMTIAKVDIDKETDLATQYGIMSIPTIVFIKDGKVEKSLVGLQPKEIIKSTALSLI